MARMPNLTGAVSPASTTPSVVGGIDTHQEEEIAELDKLIKPLVIELAPQLLQRHGIGVEIAAQMLLTAGDNPDRLRSEASFAMLCGVAPLPASSGKTCRHRLNRGGDRQANSALLSGVISRLRHDPTTRTYLAKKIAEGHTKREAIRCLKRYLAREVYYLLKAAAPSGLNTAVLTADGSSISAHSAGAQPRSTCRSTAPQQSRA